MPSVSSSTVDIGLGYTIVIAVGRTEQMRSLKIESSERLLTTEEAAEYLRKPKQSLLNMVSQGKLTQLKLGRMNRYKFSELNQLLLTENKEGENV
jgi:excisionase family DNA binding protein